MAKHASGSITVLFMVLVSFAMVVHSQNISNSNCLFFTQVYTAPEQDSGTDARVTIKLFTNSGNTPYIVAENIAQYGDRGPSYDYFQEGAGNNFYIRSPDPCPLPNGACKIQLSHDNSGPNPSWRVLLVRVTGFSSSVDAAATTPLPSGRLKQRYDFMIQEWITGGMTVTRDLCPTATTTTTTPDSTETIKMVVN